MIRGYFLTAVIAFGVAWVAAPLLPEPPWQPPGAERQAVAQHAQRPSRQAASHAEGRTTPPAGYASDAPAVAAPPASVTAPVPGPVPAAAVSASVAQAASVALLDAKRPGAEAAGAKAPHRGEAAPAALRTSVDASRAVRALASPGAVESAAASGGRARGELVAQQEYGARCATEKGICELSVPQPLGSTCTCPSGSRRVKGTTIR